MFDGLRDVIVLAVGISKFLVRFALLIFILVFLAEDQELGQVLDRTDHIPLFLADVADLLVTVGLCVHIVRLLGHVHTFLVKLKGHVVLTLVLVFFSDLLVDAYQVLQNFDLDSVEISFSCLF